MSLKVSSCIFFFEPISFLSKKYPKETSQQEKKSQKKNTAAPSSRATALKLWRSGAALPLRRRASIATACSALKTKLESLVCTATVRRRASSRHHAVPAHERGFPWPRRPEGARAQPHNPSPKARRRRPTVFFTVARALGHSNPSRGRAGAGCRRRQPPGASKQAVPPPPPARRAQEGKARPPPPFWRARAGIAAAATGQARARERSHRRQPGVSAGPCHSIEDRREREK